MESMAFEHNVVLKYAMRQYIFDNLFYDSLEEAVIEQSPPLPTNTGFVWPFVLTIYKALGPSYDTVLVINQAHT